MSIAFAFCGKIGTYKTQGRHSNHADPSLIRSSFASFRRHVYDSSAHKIKHVYIHSWNPESKDLITTLYAPQKALFEHTMQGFPGCRETSDCFRVFSHLRGIHRVLSMVYEQERMIYEFVFLSRFDILWRVPFSYSVLPLNSFVLPEHCSTLKKAPVHSNAGSNADDKKCAPRWVASLENPACSDFICRFNPYIRNHAVLDMWIIGNHSLMKQFGQIGSNGTFHALHEEVLRRKPAWIVSHVYWGFFLREKPVVHVNYNEWIDWSLSRFPGTTVPWSNLTLCYPKPPIQRKVFPEKCSRTYFCTLCDEEEQTD